MKTRTDIQSLLAARLQTAAEIQAAEKAFDDWVVSPERKKDTIFSFDLQLLAADPEGPTKVVQHFKTPGWSPNVEKKSNGTNKTHTLTIPFDLDPAAASKPFSDTPPSEVSPITPSTT